MIKLIEEELILKVRQEDIKLVEGLLEECQREYSHIMHRATKRDEYKTSLRLMRDKFLTPEERGSCGGVILYAHNYRIVCSNTLEERLELSFEMALPKIRQVLFPAAN
jgi:V-type H+-transporting ATPase subunit E